MLFIVRNLNLSYLNILRRSAHQSVKSTPESTKFTPIYKLPHIGICATISRCKVPQLLGSGIIIPATYIGYAVEAFGAEVPVAVTGVGLASTAAVFAIGQLFTRLVGFVYVSEDKEQIKISYLDSWGKRKDDIYNVKDSLQVSDTSWPHSIFYKHIKVSSSSKPYYKISTQFGDVLHSSQFNEIFDYSFEGD